MTRRAELISNSTQTQELTLKSRVKANTITFDHPRMIAEFTTEHSWRPKKVHEKTKRQTYFLMNQLRSLKLNRNCSQKVTVTIVTRFLISKMDLQYNNHNRHRLHKTQLTFVRTKGHCSQKLNDSSKTKYRTIHRLLLQSMNVLRPLSNKDASANVMRDDKQQVTKDCHAC